MKIIHILDYLPYYHQKGGGAERAAYNIIKLLEKNNHQNIVVTLKPDLKPAVNKEVVLKPVKQQERIIGWKLSFKKRIFNFDIFIFFQVLKILKKERPDRIHIYNIPIISLAPILAAWFLKIPVYYFIYDYWPFCAAKLLLDREGNHCQQYNSKKCQHCVATNIFSERLNLKWRKKIHDFFLKKVTKFITLSNASAQEIINYGFNKNKVTVVRLIVEDLKNLNKNFQPNIILYTGWLQQRKGLHVIIKAMPEIIKRHPNAELIILNLQQTREYRDYIDGLIKKFNLSKNIKWYAKISREEFQNILGSAGVVVIPEQWPNMSPVILLESMSASKAIVASNIGGLPEFIDNGVSGYIAKHDSSENFAQKISDLLNNPEKIKLFGENARKKFEEKFNQEIIYQQLLKAYEPPMV